MFFIDFTAAIGVLPVAQPATAVCEVYSSDWAASFDLAIVDPDHPPHPSKLTVTVSALPDMAIVHPDHPPLPPKLIATVSALPDMAIIGPDHPPRPPK
jgi:hypothetical protein